ncbi:MAG: heat-inducible transcription repressor HrcA [Armatimonadetes bacterium]|nr:heat-inducible transcription repressor HrcA [Armatimonadota bacterium]
MLTIRRQAILRAIISEYIVSAEPVSSGQIVKRYELTVSPATIRNEMAELEDEGYVTHPHTSAGRVPTDRGYRYYVSALLGSADLPEPIQRMVRHQFHQVEDDVDEWTRLAAAMLARLVQNAAVVSLPRPMATRLKLFQLFAVHDLRALVVVLLAEGIVKQQLMTFSEPVPSDELTAIANRLNHLFGGLTAPGIRQQLEASDPEGPWTDLEQRVAAILLRVLDTIDRQEFEEVWVEGLRNLLNQPEFKAIGRMQAMLDVLGERNVVRSILPPHLPTGEVHITIGEEHPQAALRECSVVFAGYGIPGDFEGVLGVIGPTRMAYDSTIASVRYLSELMSELLQEIHG